MIYFVVSLERFVVRITSEINENDFSMEKFILRYVLDISWRHQGQDCHQFKWCYTVMDGLIPQN